MANLLADGIIFFNSGRYFEAHETWEGLWRPSQNPARLFYQGLVQAAVALHHLHHSNPNGARAQLVKSLQKLEQYPAAYCEIDNKRLIEDLRRTLEDMRPERFEIFRSNAKSE
jgi:uncharacterized protein